MKLGGLGANIGGDEWVEKKKKLDKMQVWVSNLGIFGTSQIDKCGQTKSS